MWYSFPTSILFLVCLFKLMSPLLLFESLSLAILYSPYGDSIILLMLRHFTVIFVTFAFAGFASIVSKVSPQASPTMFMLSLSLSNSSFTLIVLSDKWIFATLTALNFSFSTNVSSSCFSGLMNKYDTPVESSPILFPTLMWTIFDSSPPM